MDGPGMSPSRLSRSSRLDSYRADEVWPRARVPRRTWVALLLAASLWWVFIYYTRWPSVQNKSDIMTVLASGAPNTFNELVSRDGWSYWWSWIPTGINMNDNNAIGMAFAFLIGGVVSTLALPSGLTGRLLRSRGAAGASLGGLLGAPLMMCSACSVPVAVGWHRRGANVETTLGVVTGASLLNVMGLLTIFSLFPAPLFWGRLLASVLMVAVVTPAVASIGRRMGPRTGSPTVCAVPPGDSLLPPPGLLPPVTAGTPSDAESWPTAIRLALRDWWWSSAGMAYRLWVPMTAAVFLAAALRLVVPPETVTTFFGGGLPAIALVAAFGTLIAIPTMFEIPLTIGFLFLGMGLGPATALLVAAPSVSVVSYFLLRKTVGHLPPLLLMAATFVMATLAGLLVEMGLGVV